MGASMAVSTGSARREALRATQVDARRGRHRRGTKGARETTFTRRRTIKLDQLEAAKAGFVPLRRLHAASSFIVSCAA